MRKCNAGDKKGSGRITGESFLAPNQWRGWKAVVGGLRSGLGGLRVSVRTCFSQYLPVQCSCSGGGGTATSRRSPSPTFLTTNYVAQDDGSLMVVSNVGLLHMYQLLIGFVESPTYIN